MPDSSRIENLLIKQVNSSRARRGLPKLTLNRSLREVSRKHSLRMAKRGKIWHGSGVSTAVHKLHHNYVGENCAMVPFRKRSMDIASDLHKAWMSSPGHKANILNRAYGQVGIGVKKGKTGYFGTQLFCEGTPSYAHKGLIFQQGAKEGINPIKLIAGVFVLIIVWIAIYKFSGIIVLPR